MSNNSNLLQIFKFLSTFLSSFSCKFHNIIQTCHPLIYRQLQINLETDDSVWSIYICVQILIVTSRPTRKLKFLIQNGPFSCENHPLLALQENFISAGIWPRVDSSTLALFRMGKFTENLDFLQNLLLTSCGSHVES